MTEETKKLIESVQTFIPLRAMSTCLGGGGSYILKSDFDRVVEELTKWNKVEECLPEKGSRILVKHVDENVHLCLCPDGVNFIDPDDYIAWCNVIEWKYIN